jgi:Cu(I)/Ag(I) efflux system membrane fusion protein
MNITEKISNVRKLPKKTLLCGLLVLLAVFTLGRCAGGDQQPAAHSEAEHLGEAKTQIWTCSMHPQIKLPKPGKCPICGMDLIPLENDSAEDGALRELTVSENAARLMQIETSPAEHRFAQTDVRMVGKVDFDETRTAFITARMPGRLDRLFVDYTGVQVKKGDHLASIYSPELLSAQQELLQAIDSVKALQNSQSALVRNASQSTVEAVREKLRLWGLPAEQIQEIETRGTLTDHLTLYSPVGGVVIHKNAQEGGYVKTGDRIYTVADLSRVWVQLEAYESDLPWLRYGQKVTFTTEAWPGENFEGTIAFIDPVLNAATRSVNVRVNVDNPDLKMKPGMFVRAVAHPVIANDGKVTNPSLAGKWISPMHPEIVKDGPGSCDVCGMPLVRAEELGYVAADEINAPLVIPATAPLLTGTRAIVYVELPGKEKPTYEGREIILGPRAGNVYIVRHGLKAGERVVTKGAFKLDAELQIRAKPSMMTPEGGGGGGMAGMDHGEKKMAPEEMEKMSTPSVSLPMAARMQLQTVQTAAQAALEALSNGSDARPLFQTLEKSIADVNTTALPAAAKPLWKEAAMLLGNDAAVGQMVSSKTSAATLTEQLRTHLNSFVKQLGLGDSKPMEMESANVAFSRSLQPLFAEYLSIQKSLAGDTLPDASAALRVLDAVDMGLLEGSEHMQWMPREKVIRTALEQMKNTTDIATARRAFSKLSATLSETGALFQPLETLYEFSCPMAFGSESAVWLQDNDQTSNPYLGDAMPTCGELIQVLEKPEHNHE